MAKRAICALFCLAATLCAHGQKYAYAYGNEDKVRELSRLSPTSRTESAIRDALNIGDGTNTAKLVFYVAGYRKFLQEVENARMDKQAGASSSSQGATSIVSKGVASQILSLATEQGALARTDSKTTSTFQVNTIGVARLLGGTEEFPYCAVYDYACESALARLLRGASAGVSFFTTSGSSSSSSLTSGSNNNNILNPSAHQIAGWNVRYDFHVRRPTTELAKSYQTQFKQTYTQAETDGDAVLAAVGTILSRVRTSDAYVDWIRKYISRLRSSDAETAAGLQSVLADAVRDLAQVAKAQDPNLQADAESVIAKMSTYFGNRDRLMADFINRITFSAEYDNDRPTNEPTQSAAKFIISVRPQALGSTALLTGNASVQWYDQLLQSNVSRIRDAQVSLQLDHKFGGTNATVAPTLSAGYYFQYMVDKALINLPSSALAPGTSIPLPGNASELLNTTGPIHLGQVKVSFSIRNSGLNIPIALTFSNRTDLIKGNDVRGNFGISYDLDSLFAKN